MKEHEPLSSKEKVSIFLPLLLGLALAGGTWLGLTIGRNSAQESYVTVSDGKQQYSRRSGKVEEILRFIDARYLETEEKEKLEDVAIDAILEELDPHSSYISLDAIDRVKESMTGNFEGIGIEFFILEDTIYVVGVVEDGPSDKAGIQKGDKIIMINDTLVAGKDVYNKDVIDRLKGPAKSQVSLKVQRYGQDELQEVVVTRGKIAMPSIDVACMLDEKVGIIKLNRFSGTTYKEFMTELRRLVEEEDMKDLILDLRHNPGGYLNAATQILEQLFDSRKLLVYTEGRSFKRKNYESKGQATFDLGKVIILIDESSASASEIVAGAIQDNDRGLVLGRRSFGKGLVQEQYELTDGSALRLTIARYFTPSGRYIQKPYEKKDATYDDDLRNRYESGELYHKDSIRITDSTVYRTTSGRIVHGGGGIVPDIFIPLDTTVLNPYFLTLNNYVRNFVYKYLDAQRESLAAAYPTYDAFEENFVVDKALFNAMLDYVKTKDIPLNDAATARFKSQLKLRLKSHVADQLFGAIGLYQTLFTTDPMVQRALQELHRKHESVSPPIVEQQG